MIKKQYSDQARLRRHQRVRKKVSGTSQRPRLAVFRSATQIYAQVIDDTRSHTLRGGFFARSTSSQQRRKKIERADRERRDGGGDQGADEQQARRAGVAGGPGYRAACEGAGHTTVVFDRGGYIYHGRVAALAEGARKGGLDF